MGVNSDTAKEAVAGKSRRETLAWLVAIAWFFAAGGALGYFMFKDQRAFEASRVSLFDSQLRARAAEAWFRERYPESGAGVVATVVSLSRPGCTCNRFTERHLAKIEDRYAAAGVRFVTVERFTGLDWVDSTPAALVFNRSGALAYFGPYSSSAWCGIGGGLVEPVLDKLLKGTVTPLQPFYGSGCFCSRESHG